MRPGGFAGCFASVKAPNGAIMRKPSENPLGKRYETGMGAPLPESPSFTAGSMSNTDHRPSPLAASPD